MTLARKIVVNAKATRVGAVLLIFVGFALAVLTHPMWHSMSAASDKVIDRLLLSGIACTLVGILVFFHSIRGLDQRTKRLWLIPALLILTPVVGLLWFRFIHVPPFTVAEAGGKISRGDLSMRTPTTLIAPPEAGIVFSTVSVPGQQEQFAFLILFDYGGELVTYSSSSPNTNTPFLGRFQLPDGQWAEAVIGFAVNGKPIDGTYYVKLDDSLTKVATETISVGDNTYDLSAGRVLLIDLAKETPNCRQIDVTMPPIPSKLETRYDILRAGVTLRKTLAERHQTIDEFLD
jgi:hypothetical protein